MATPKKKHLIELMIEAGVEWPDGAEYAAQDKDCQKVHFYKTKPLKSGDTYWNASGCIAYSGIELDSLCRNWHQTIVTREQYAEAVAGAAMTPAAQQETQPSHEYCASVMRQMPNNTIEQLTADYHAKAAEADRLQAVADEALKAADDALLALEKAGELLGLVISIDTKPKHPVEPEQPIITDWRDLRVGDVVEHIEDNGGDLRIGSIGKISEVDEECINVDYEGWEGYSYGVPDDLHKFKFIRRP